MQSLLSNPLCPVRQENCSPTWMGKQRHRQGNGLSQDHTSNEWVRQDQKSRVRLHVNASSTHLYMGLLCGCWLSSDSYISISLIFTVTSTTANPCVTVAYQGKVTLGISTSSLPPFFPQYLTLEDCFDVLEIPKTALSKAKVTEFVFLPSHRPPLLPFDIVNP